MKRTNATCDSGTGRTPSQLSVMVAAVILTGAASADLPGGTIELSSLNSVPNGEFGSVTLGLPDLNNDGRGELLVEAPGETVYVEVGGTQRPLAHAGRAYVFDGATADLLYSIQALNPTSGAYFGGFRIAGDVNQDGVVDLMVRDEGRLAGVLLFFDGQDGEFLFELRSPDPAGRLGAFGFGAGALGDVDGDGQGDWLVGEGRWSGTTGRIYVFSGATREVLWQRDVRALGRLGFGCEALPDLNGDGAGDVAVARPFEAAQVDGKTVEAGGYLAVFSGKDGSQLHTCVAGDAQAGDWLGETITCPGDVDGDDIPDLAVGSHTGGPDQEGRVWLFSGADGSWIRTLASPNAQSSSRFGRGLGVLPDRTGDSVWEVWVRADGEERNYVFDGASGALLDPLELPGSEDFYLGCTTDNNGTQLGSLVFSHAYAGPDRSGRVYLVSEHPFPPRLHINKESDDTCSVSYRGEMDQIYAVEGSNDLREWAEVGVLPREDGTSGFIAEVGSAPYQFFRLRALE